MPTILPRSLARHYKGGLYRIQGSCTIEASLEEGVLYQAVDPQARQDLWLRPLSDFLADVSPGVSRFDVFPAPEEDALRSVLPLTILPEHVLQSVRTQYREPHRFYHGWDHVLGLFETARKWGLRLTPTQGLAILYHDVVYVPGAPVGLNERNSVRTVMQRLSQFANDIPVDWAGVCTIIEDTAGHKPSHPESAAVLALDLSSLAGSPAEFAVANELVWLENRHLLPASDNLRATFDGLRKQFLQGMAEKGPVFPVGFEHLETAFQRNLSAL